MTTKPLELKRGAYGLVAAALTMVVAAASLLPGFADAGQVQTRSIKMSDSAPSGGTITSGVGSGTNVTYEISFDAPTASNIGGLVVDICGNTPLIEDTSCTLPAGFSWGSATPPATITSGLTDANWTDSSEQGAGASAAAPQALKMTTATPETPGAGGVITIDVTGVTNPSTDNTGFYARILTFDTAANADAYISTNTATRPYPATGMVDYGGVAMSTSTPISITARVMESMLLCTSLAVPGEGCTGISAPVLILGQGVNQVLDNTISTGTVYSQVSTNATNGYFIRIHSNNACGGLSKDGGTTCPIPAINSGGNTPFTMVGGTAAFGMQATAGAPVGAGVGTNTVAADYQGTVDDYAFDTTTAGNNATSTYGDTVIDGTNQQASSVNNSYKFAATASNTTPAGIYTALESLIATGTF